MSQYGHCRFITETSIVKLLIGFIHINIFVRDNSTSYFVSWFNLNATLTFQVMLKHMWVRRNFVMPINGCCVQVMIEDI